MMRSRLPVFSFRKIRCLHPLHLDAERALECEQLTTLVNSEESRGETLRARSSRSSHAMDEVLGDFRQIVVDDLGDVVHVNPARGQISRYKDADTPLLESGECRGALRLRTPAVNHGRSEAFAVQAESQAFASALGAREDENSALILSQQAAQHIEFAIGGDFESLHANVF